MKQLQAKTEKRVWLRDHMVREAAEARKTELAQQRKVEKEERRRQVMKTEGEANNRGVGVWHE